MAYTEIQACRMCGNRALDSVFHLGTQALTGVFPKTPEALRALTRGPLELVKCRVDGGAADSCGLLQMRQSYVAAEMYGDNYGYGASTKGNVILQYCGLSSQDLPCIAKVNADKFGAFTPGTGIPIVSEKEAKAGKPDYFLVLPWHFRDNILQREREYLQSGGKLVFPLPEIEVVGASP